MASSSASFVSIFKAFLMMMRSMDVKDRIAILQVINLNHIQLCQAENQEVIEMGNGDKVDKACHDETEDNTGQISEHQDNINKRKRVDNFEDLNRKIRKLLAPLEQWNWRIPPATKSFGRKKGDCRNER